MLADAELRFPSRRADIMAMPISAPRYTVDQVRAFPADGQRYELLDGLLLVTPAPRNLHQVVATRLVVELANATMPENLEQVVAVGELEIGTTTLLNPDILVYPKRYGPGTPWKQIQEWWLAVEVLSPSSRVYDREFKRQAYQAIGVEEVWLVDPDAHAVEIWSKGASAPRMEHESIEWRAATIDLRRVF